MSYPIAFLLLGAAVLPVRAELPSNPPVELLNGTPVREFLRGGEAAGLPAPVAARVVIEDVEAACYSLDRLVEWKWTAEPEALYKRYGARKGYLSRELLANIAGIMTDWGYYKEGTGYHGRLEDLWLTELTIDNGGLHGRMTFEKADFPVGGEWDFIWAKDMTFALDKPFVFNSAILEKDFRVKIVFSVEKDKSLCRLPDFPPLPQ